MEVLNTIVQSLPQNALTLIVLAGSIWIFWGVRKGTISFSSKEGLRISEKSEEATRIYLRDAFEVIEIACESMARSIQIKMPELDEYRTKWICSRVENILQQAVVLNSMNDSDQYIKRKAEKICNSVRKRTVLEYFETQEFENSVEEFTSNVVKKILDLKKPCKKVF